MEHSALSSTLQNHAGAQGLCGRLVTTARARAGTVAASRPRTRARPTTAVISAIITTTVESTPAATESQTQAGASPNGGAQPKREPSTDRKTIGVKDRKTRFSPMTGFFSNRMTMQKQRESAEEEDDPEAAERTRLKLLAVSACQPDQAINFGTSFYSSTNQSFACAREPMRLRNFGTCGRAHAS